MTAEAAAVQVKGDLLALKNRKKEPGDDRPVFQGHLTIPGDPQKRPFALWAYPSERSGGTVLSGRVSQSAKEQIDAMARPDKTQVAGQSIEILQKDGGEGLKIDPGAIVMFVNPSKSAEHPNRPDHFGYANVGGDKPLIRVSAWATVDRTGSAMLTGATQLYDAKREQTHEQMEDLTKDQELEPVR
jgi:hypothetical protein